MHGCQTGIFAYFDQRTTSLTRMKRTLTLVIACLPAFCFGQSLWRKAVVITNDGKQLDGLIYDLEWNVNPKEIEFKVPGQDVQKFTADDIAEFSTDRPSKYRALEVSYDGDDQTIGKLSRSKEPVNVIREKLFVRVIVDGDISLLAIRDKTKRTHFFMATTGQAPTELLLRMYNPTDEKVSGLYYEKYKQQLTVTTNDCPEVQRSLKSINYAEATLERVFKKINACKNSAVQPLWKGEAVKKAPNFGLTGQLFLSRTEFTGLVFKAGELNYGAGIFGEFYSRKRPNRLSLYTELLYKTFNQEGVNLFTNQQTVNLSFKRLKLITAARFSYPVKSGERFYWTMGLENGYRISPEQEGPAVAGQEVKSEFEVGVIVAFGKTFRIGAAKFNAEARYELEQKGFASSTNFVGSHNIGLNLQYNLK
jgi:hypothetical protein